jgi:GDPmannose 4,6-dehydratase
MKKKVALITGITGQDGSYLAELLIEKGYCVHGIKRRSSTVNTGRLTNLFDKNLGLDSNENFKLHHGDMTDSTSLSRIIRDVMPDEIYNLAAQSHVRVSFEEPEYTANSDALGVLRILEEILRLKEIKKIKFYQASTSELYGGQQEGAYNENSPFLPRSPYAIAKQYAYYITKMYREAYDIYAVNGILFNHESPRRSENFVTKKITTGIAKILAGEQKRITLGNLDAKRDWGHAKDYVIAQWMMLQSPKPIDYIIATGENHSIREFLKKSFELIGYEIEFIGENENEIGRISKIIAPKSIFRDLLNYSVKLEIGQQIIFISKDFYRPLEVDSLLGDASKARDELGWIPKITFNKLIEEMLMEDIKNNVKDNSKHIN